MRLSLFALFFCLCAGPRSSVAETPPWQIGGYVEADYQWNFNRPSNGITNFRGFDNRHNTFTLSNVALDAQWDQSNVIGRLTLQVGHTPSTYYAAEPSVSGASGANATDAALWKYLQQAYVGYRFVPELVLAAGVFLSPIGPESMAVRDNWNWSRSNLFFGLPFYHTGARATYTLSDAWSATVALFNGWNSVVDNNGAKSASAQLLYTRADVSVSLLYFGGVERTPGGFRQLLDAHITWHVSSRLSLLAHANVGFEPTHFGVSHWQAGALYARVELLPSLFVAIRADAFFEHAAVSGERSAARIFWPADWVSSETLTVDYRPQAKMSFRLEYRHDQAGGDMYFGRGASFDVPDLPDRASQDTLTLGATAWF